MLDKVKGLYKKHGKKIVFAYIGWLAVKWFIIIAFGSYIIDWVK